MDSVDSGINQSFIRLRQTLSRLSAQRPDLSIEAYQLTEQNEKTVISLIDTMGIKTVFLDPNSLDLADEMLECLLIHAIKTSGYRKVFQGKREVLRF